MLRRNEQIRIEQGYHQPIGFEDQLRMKYSKYQRDGKLVLALTLSSYVYDERFAASAGMAYFWDSILLPKIDRRLPYKLKNKFDHDYVIERAPHGNWHYHGMLALPEDVAPHIWRDGNLNRHLRTSLHSLKTASSRQPFGIGSYLIEPVDDRLGGIEGWVNYITKTADYKSSDEYPRHNSKIALGTSPSSQVWIPSERNFARQQRGMLPR
jgi:hypothetical protein